ncbi:MAG: hypothetical protein ACRD1U_14955 [Vicinamibacterales bacterium]
MDSKVVLAPGEQSVVASDLSVRFLEVVGDSRCPGDALCITGGDAIVRVDVTAGEINATRDLHTGVTQPVTVDGVRIELLQLDPYPFSSRPPIEPADYRATLRVVR